VTGVDIFKCKVTAFAISASLAGLAGGIYAYFRLSLLPLSAFTPLWTFTPLMAASIGGAGTFMGPIIGCLFLVILQEVFALTLGEAYLIVFGILFILVVLFFPYGLIGIFDRVKTLALPASRAR
jgi:branched-chain amino acid transport system permease protein